MIFAKPKNLLKSNVTNRTDNGISLFEMTIQCVPLIKWMFAMIQLTILLVPNVFVSSNRIIFCCYVCCLVESFRCFYFITVCFDTCNVAALLLFYFFFIFYSQTPIFLLWTTNEVYFRPSVSKIAWLRSAKLWFYIMSMPSYCSLLLLHRIRIAVTVWALHWIQK